MKLLIIGIVLLAITFLGGWLMPEIYSDKWFEDEQTHFAGLKFMPPCKPFGADVSCGFDPLLIIWILICIVMIIIDVPPNKQKNDSEV